LRRGRKAGGCLECGGRVAGEAWGWWGEAVWSMVSSLMEQDIRRRCSPNSINYHF
jgi:hypothetical protein